MAQKQDSNEYRKMLLLAYFQSNYKKYEYSEAVRLLGITYDELKRLVDNLIEQQLLIHTEDYLVVSKKGEQKLFDERMDYFFAEKKAENEDLRWDINKPYIPISFSL